MNLVINLQEIKEIQEARQNIIASLTIQAKRGNKEAEWLLNHM